MEYIGPMGKGEIGYAEAQKLLKIELKDEGKTVADVGAKEFTDLVKKFAKMDSSRTARSWLDKEGKKEFDKAVRDAADKEWKAEQEAAGKGEGKGFAEGAWNFAGKGVYAGALFFGGKEFIQAYEDGGAQKEEPCVKKCKSRTNTEQDQYSKDPVPIPECPDPAPTGDDKCDAYCSAEVEGACSGANRDARRKEQCGGGGFWESTLNTIECAAKTGGDMLTAAGKFWASAGTYITYIVIAIGVALGLWALKIFLEAFTHRKISNIKSRALRAGQGETNINMKSFGDRGASKGKKIANPWETLTK
jgi:hypothetical protein